MPRALDELKREVADANSPPGSRAPEGCAGYAIRDHLTTLVKPIPGVDAAQREEEARMEGQ